MQAFKKTNLSIFLLTVSFEKPFLGANAERIKAERGPKQSASSISCCEVGQRRVGIRNFALWKISRTTPFRFLGNARGTDALFLDAKFKVKSLICLREP